MLFLVLTILIQIVSAVGISPAKKYINYVPGESETNTIRVFSDSVSDMDIIVHVQGDIAKYIELEKEFIEIKEGQKQAEIKYTINMPDELLKPGIHEGDIIAFEVPKGKDINEFGVGAVIAVSSAVKLRVPYPKKYAEANLYIENAEQGEGVGFLIPVFNYGLESFETYAKIEIYGATYEKIDEFYTNTLTLQPKEDGQLGGGWIADVNQGIYKAVVTIYYGEEIIRLEENFDVGSIYVKILGISIEDFVLGGIAQFDILIENIWGENIGDVYADIIFKDTIGNEYGRFKTAEEDLSKYGDGILNAYWDTKGLSTGEYYMDITLYYADKTTKELIKTFVNLDSITTNRLMGNVVKGKGESNVNLILITGIVIMVILNLVFMWYFKKRKKK